MPEWFHTVLNVESGEFLFESNELNKNQILKNVKRYNRAEQFMIKNYGFVQPRSIINFLIYRSFVRLDNPTVEDIFKTEDVTRNFNVKPPEQVQNLAIQIEREKKTGIRMQAKAKVRQEKRSLNLENKAIFIVHGHDEKSKQELSFLLTNMGLKPTVLNEEPDDGKTIIEKLEYYSSDVGYAIVLLTPDDYGGIRPNSVKPRARQNVILEMGFFIGRIGRNRMLCLVKGKDTEEPLEKPSDVSGIVTHRYEKKVDECSKHLYRNLISAGYEVR